MSKQKSILDKSLPKGTQQTSLSAFSFLFCEYIRREFRKENKPTTAQFHEKLFDLGFNVGMRMTELVTQREKESERKITMDSIVNFIAKEMWNVLFGHQVDVGKVRGKPNEFLITDKKLIITKYIGYEKDRGVHPVYFVAGVAQSCIDGADFRATVNCGEDEDGPYLHIVFQE